MATFETRDEEFSINLSALDIENKQMRDFIIATLKGAPAVASRLTFEIVEQEGVKHIENIKEFVTKILEQYPPMKK